MPPANEDTSASDHKTPLQPVLAVNNVHTEVPLNLDKNSLQGMSYYRSGDVFLAEFAFRQAVKTKPREGPEDIVATMFLGRIALDREDFSGARDLVGELFVKLRDSDIPEIVECWDSMTRLGRAHYQLGSFENACYWYHRAICGYGEINTSHKPNQLLAMKGLATAVPV